eukprot:1113615-Amorphochlora_amoeboformis.AAC.1
MEIWLDSAGIFQGRIGERVTRLLGEKGGRENRIVRYSRREMEILLGSTGIFQGRSGERVTR